MKMHITFVIFLLLALTSIPAAADTLYDNGPTNGTTDAWTVNFGFVVSDTFTLSSNSTVQGLNFAVWLAPGDILETADVSITSNEFGGTTYFSGTVSFAQSGCASNQYGYNVCMESGTIPDTALSAGTYWLNLQNGVVNTGDPVYWDENSGPSQASENSVGTIPSESFTILGSGGTITFPTPEPDIIMLLGAGFLGAAGVLRFRML